MLVMSREAGEILRIGDVQVSVVGIENGRVRLGIASSHSTRIMRAEVASPSIPATVPQAITPIPQTPVEIRQRVLKAKPRKKRQKRRLWLDRWLPWLLRKVIGIIIWVVIHWIWEQLREKMGMGK